VVPLNIFLKCMNIIVHKVTYYCQLATIPMTLVTDKVEFDHGTCFWRHILNCIRSNLKVHDGLKNSTTFI